jgi:hypothetical protein
VRQSAGAHDTHERSDETVLAEEKHADPVITDH